jgi:hypothetical protein
VTDVGRKPARRFLVKLTTINSLVRWTGFRVFVEWSYDWRVSPIRIGVVWWGWDK